MSNTTTAIVLPKKAKKEHVIAALVERAKARHLEENKKLNAAREGKEKELQTAAIEYLKQALPSIVEVDVSVYRGKMSLGVDILNIPEHLQELDKQLDELPHARPFDPAQAKRDIQAHLTGQSPAVASVQTMLADPATVTALDEILDGMA